VPAGDETDVGDAPAVGVREQRDPDGHDPVVARRQGRVDLEADIGEQGLPNQAIMPWAAPGAV
jgi:hypothetical protein